MKSTLIKISAGLFCLAGLTSSAMAVSVDLNSSSAPPSTTGENIPPGSGDIYATQAPPSTTSYNHYEPVVSPPYIDRPPHRHHKHQGHVSLSVMPTETTTYVSYEEHGPRYPARHGQPPFWIPMHSGEPIPTNAVIGGSQHYPNTMMYVCRANYHGGVHPGKFFNGNCNISWGGREVVMHRFEMLVSNAPLSWEESSYGAFPRHAIEGGYENHRKLFICQAEYENGTHPGKLIGNNCNFGWGGKEMMTPYYSVLVG